MKKFILFFTVIMAIALNSQCQNEPNAQDKPNDKKKCCFKISSLSVANGFNNYREISHGGWKGDFDKTQNGMNNWNSGNIGFMMNNKGNNDIISRNQMSLQMGLMPYSRKLGDYNRKRELVIGLYYSGSDLQNKNSSEFTTIPGDTFTYHSAIFRTDTITHTQRTYRELANVLGASVQYLYKTDPDRRFSLYTGYGLDAGCTVSARIEETYSADKAVVVNYFSSKPSFNGFDNGNSLSSEKLNASFRAERMIFGSVFIPFGVNLRLCKKKEIWNQMNLFAQGRFGVETEVSFSGNAHFYPYMGGSMGFKFDLK